MKYNNLTKITLGVLMGLQIPTFAGPAAEAAPASNCGDWCSMLKSKPKLYKNRENPYIQEIGIEGRLQWQTASTDVDDVNGAEFSETFTEFRRARLGTKIKFLNYFTAKYQVNMVDDDRPSNGDIEWDYQDIDEAYLEFNLGKAINCSYFDSLSLGYGRYKYTLGYESTTSSKKLLTPERSSLGNKVYGSARPTGLKLEAEKGDWEFAAAIYSTSADGDEHETFGSWQDGENIWFHAAYSPDGPWSYGFDLSYNNADIGDDNEAAPHKWATSFNAEYDGGNWGIIGDLIIGENLDNSTAAREGTFYGAMVMPYCWVMEDKLQWVGQIQYMASSEDEGVRINSRYGRRTESYGADVNSGRGDSHLSLYTGLNYYLCDHNAKIQAGVEYQDLDTPDGNIDALTYILAVRTYF